MSRGRIADRVAVRVIATALRVRTLPELRAGSAGA
jgi:hypothetical protein